MRNKVGSSFMRGVDVRIRSASGRFVAAVTVVGLLWLGATGLVGADMRIVHESEGIRTETLLTINRIATINPDGFNTLLYCDVQEIVLLAPDNGGQYWQGSVAELRAAFQELFSPEGLGALFAGSVEDEGDDDDDDFDFGDFGALFGSLFGGDEGDAGEELQVRISKVGEETVAGYGAEHYVVETGRGGAWDVYEEIWLSPGLLADLTREAGVCVSVMMDIQNEMLASSGIGLDGFDAVVTSPEYQALMERGYPVRTKETMSFFGMTFETVHEVVEVSRNPISDDKFAVPAGYQRVGHPLAVLLPDAGM